MSTRSGLTNDPRQPDIKVTQYTSPNRQMSLPLALGPESTPAVTMPWLLSPKWSPSESVSYKKKSTKSPKEALAEMSRLYVYLHSEFGYPSLRFEGGEPVINESYVEMQDHMMKLQGLLDDLGALKVSKADDANRLQLVGAIRETIEEVDVWVEQQRVKSQKFEERFYARLASEQELEERQSESSGCIIA